MEDRIASRIGKLKNSDVWLYLKWKLLLNIWLV